MNCRFVAQLFFMIAIGLSSQSSYSADNHLVEAIALEAFPSERPLPEVKVKKIEAWAQSLAQRVVNFNIYLEKNNARFFSWKNTDTAYHFDERANIAVPGLYLSLREFVAAQQSPYMQTCLKRAGDKDYAYNLVLRYVLEIRKSDATKNALAPKPRMKTTTENNLSSARWSKFSTERMLTLLLADIPNYVGHLQHEYQQNPHAVSRLQRKIKKLFNAQVPESSVTPSDEVTTTISSCCVAPLMQNKTNDIGTVATIITTKILAAHVLQKYGFMRGETIDFTPETIRTYIYATQQIPIPELAEHIERVVGNSIKKMREARASISEIITFMGNHIIKYNKEIETGAEQPVKNLYNTTLSMYLPTGQCRFVTGLAKDPLDGHILTGLMAFTNITLPADGVQDFADLKQRVIAYVQQFAD